MLLQDEEKGMLVELANTLAMLAPIDHTRETLDIVDGLAERVSAIVSAVRSADLDALRAR